MKISFQNINAADLHASTLADLLVNIEADLEVMDHDEVVYSERAFPVAELARELVRWKASAPIPFDDFVFHSMSFDEVGSIRILEGRLGWIVGSVFAPDKKSKPLSWADLASEIDEFVERVRAGVESLGIDPHFILRSD